MTPAPEPESPVTRIADQPSGSPYDHLAVKLNRLLLLILVATTVIAFSDTLTNEFVEWDDDHVIVLNESYRGFTAGHLKWMFTTGFAGHYQPLTWISFAIDHALWGLDPFGFHLTNLVLHVIVAFGFYFVSRILIRASLPATPETPLMLAAATAALLFAVHPLRVESVAWATERRDVLSGAWLVLSVWCYLRSTQNCRRAQWLALSIVCYVFSLLSKAAGMPLPFVLLVLDAYPLRRIRIPRLSGVSGGTPPSTDSWRRVLGEKLLFLVPAAIIAFIAVSAQAESGALRTFEEHPLSLRISQAFYGLIFYLWKTLSPTGLRPLYEQRPDATPYDTEFVLSMIAAAALAVVVWSIRRRFPAILAASLIYLFWLAPVLGFAQSGPQVVADRYSYLSCMGWMVLIGGALVPLWRWAFNAGGRAFLIPSIATTTIVIALTILTRAQTRVWRDSYTLWTTIVERAPNTPTAQANLAILLNNRGEFERARDCALKTLRLLPFNRSAHLALGLAYFELGDIDASERHYRTVIELDERNRHRHPGTGVGLAVVLTRLAVVLNTASRFDEAEALYRRATQVAPHDPAVHTNLAGFLAARGREAEAMEVLRTALQVAPGEPAACYRLSLLLRANNRKDEAVTTLDQCLVVSPNDVALNAQFALVLSDYARDNENDIRRARLYAQRAMALSQGRDPLAVESLAIALAAAGDRSAAMELLDAALARPDLDLTTRTKERLTELQLRFAREDD